MNRKTNQHDSAVDSAKKSPQEGSSPNPDKPWFHGDWGLHRYALPLLLVLGLMTALRGLFRAIWFDEALTIGLVNYLSGSGITALYQAYDIPNNHIVFSYALSLWLKVLEFFCSSYPVFAYRIPGILFGLLSVALLYRMIAARSGKIPALIAGMGFAGSSTFAVYATSVRGYMLGFLLTLLAWQCAEKYFLDARKRYAWCFFGLAFLLVGTAPSNLAALSAVMLLLAIRLDGANWRRWVLLGCCVPLALVCFYLPILSKFMACAALKEGWFSGVSAIRGLYGAFFLMILPVLPFAFAGLLSLLRRCNTASTSGMKRSVFSRNVIFAILLYLLPLPTFLWFDPPMFPRVFFPLFGLWLLPQALLLREYFKGHGAGFPLLTMLLWLAMTSQWAPVMGDMMFGPDARHDDLFLPEYARETVFRPDAVVKAVAELIQQSGDEFVVFATFDSDYPALNFYATGGYAELIRSDMFLFDRPNHPPVETLPSERRVLLICRTQKELEGLLSRFHLSGAAMVGDFGAQKLYEATR